MLKKIVIDFEFLSEEQRDRLKDAINQFADIARKIDAIADEAEASTPDCRARFNELCGELLYQERNLKNVGNEN